jgi:VanZ family protein
MNLFVFSAIGLVFLVLLSYLCSFGLNILNDNFYTIFHLACGVLCFFLFFSLTQNYLLSIILTQVTGIGWEIFERYQWKLVLKKKKYRPKSSDTRNDLIVDFLGAMLGVFILYAQSI